MTGATNSELAATQPKRASGLGLVLAQGPVVRHSRHHTADYYHTVLVPLGVSAGAGAEVVAAGGSYTPSMLGKRGPVRSSFGPARGDRQVRFT